MKNTIYFFLFIFTLSGCKSTPNNFTFIYKGEDTGLSQLIDINGLYIAEHACDSTFFSIFRFYSDGRFKIATTSTLTDDLFSCFIEMNTNNYCKYILDGLYILEKDTIKTQVIWPVGNGCTIFREYTITPDNNIINISDYVEHIYSNLAYIRNYPSFYNNPCPKKIKFIRLKDLQEVKDKSAAVLHQYE
ncbi:hypothetical protein LJB92_04070 [Bacteroidales bacterium OttesenSCG-928-M06]|nr:hypothetical protein [Bacteroidales bacterium OttesenSCG-928-M06]